MDFPEVLNECLYVNSFFRILSKFKEHKLPLEVISPIWSSDTVHICMLLGMDGFVALQSSLPNPCSVCMVSRFNGRTPSFWRPRSRTSSWNRRQLIGAELFCSCPKCILSNYYHITLRYFLASFRLFRFPTFLIPTILISFVTVNSIQMAVWIFGSCCLTQIPSKYS